MTSDNVLVKFKKYVDAIIECADNVDEVSFTSMKAGSLMDKVARKLKEKRDNKLKSRLCYLWMKIEVKEYIQKKLNENYVSNGNISRSSSCQNISAKAEKSDNDPKKALVDVRNKNHLIVVGKSNVKAEDGANIDNGSTRDYGNAEIEDNDGMDEKEENEEDEEEDNNKTEDEAKIDNGSTKDHINDENEDNGRIEEKEEEEDNNDTENETTEDEGKIDNGPTRDYGNVVTEDNGRIEENEEEDNNHTENETTEDEAKIDNGSTRDYGNAVTEDNGRIEEKEENEEEDNNDTEDETTEDEAKIDNGSTRDYGNAVTEDNARMEEKEENEKDDEKEDNNDTEEETTEDGAKMDTGSTKDHGNSENEDNDRTEEEEEKEDKEDNNEIGEVEDKALKDDKDKNYPIVVGKSYVKAENVEKENILNKNMMKKVAKDLMFEWEWNCEVQTYGSVRANTKKRQWVFYGRCTAENHKAAFRFDVFHVSINQTLIYEFHGSCSIKSSTYCSTSNNKKHKRIAGDERIKMKELLRGSTASHLYYKDIENCDEDSYNAGNIQNSKKINTLHKIRSEDKNADGKSLDNSEYVKLTKFFIDLRTKGDSPLQNISIPLKISLYHKNQLTIIDEGNIPITLYLSATIAGCAVPQFGEINDIFNYTFLYATPENKLPVAEFITIDNKMVALQHFFREYKSFVYTQKRRWPYFNQIVVDWYWPLIEGLIVTWNDSLDVDKYLLKTYKYIKQIEPLPAIVLVICTTESTIRQISIDIEQEFSLSSTSKVFLLECMTLLTLSDSLENIKMILNDLFKILLCKNEHQIKNNVNIIRDYIRKKRNIIDEVLKRVSCDNEKGKELKVNKLRLNKHGNEPKRIKSPYFDEINPHWVARKDSLRDQEDEDEEISNNFYIPDFGDYIMRNFVPSLPFITKIMKEAISNNISLKLNDFIDDYIYEYHYEILKNNEKWPVTTLCKILIENGKYRVNENLLKLKAENPEYEIEEKINDPEPASNPLEYTKWGRKAADIRKQIKKKKKTIYSSGKDFIPIKNNENSINLPKKPKSKTNLKSAKNPKTKIPENKPKKINNRRTKNLKRKFQDISSEESEDMDIENSENEVDNRSKKKSKYSKLQQIITHSSDSENDENDAGPEIEIREERMDTPEYSLDTVKEAKVPKERKILENGLISNAEYYENHPLENCVICHHNFKTSKMILFRQYELTVKMISSVTSEKGWIDGQCIDTYVGTQIKNWKNLTYLPTDIGGEILGREDDLRLHPKRSMLNIVEPIGELILIPYVYLNHWRLLVIDMKNQTLQLYDPYEKSFEKWDRIQKNLDLFLNACDTKSSMKKLQGIEWAKGKSNSKRPYQRDDHNCGVYVCYYIECISNNSDFEQSFDPKIYRAEMMKQILLSSDSVMKNCLYCYGVITRRNKDGERSCVECKRKIHQKCLKKYDSDTDQLKKCKNETKLADYICILCRKSKSY